jgi:hypothetical protein
MGCGCKGQKQEPIVPKGIKPIVVETVQPTTINYTIEELIRVKDYISSTNKKESERQFVQEFMMKEIGMIVPDYCDQICLSNLRLRVKVLEDKMKIN